MDKSSARKYQDRLDGTMRIFATNRRRNDHTRRSETIREMMILKFHRKFTAEETQYLIVRGWTVEGDRRHAVKGNRWITPKDLLDIKTRA